MNENDVFDEIEEIHNTITQLRRRVTDLTTRKTFKDLINLVRLQEERINELTQTLGRREEEYKALRRETRDWMWEFGGADDHSDPAYVFEFLLDVGFDPLNLPSSVGERMALRDAIINRLYA